MPLWDRVKAAVSAFQSESASIGHNGGPALDRVEPSPAPAAFREATGTTVDAEEEGWKRVSGDQRRDLAPMTQDRMRQIALFLWESNLVANRLIELPVAYLLAEGFSLTVKDEEAQGWLKAFWRDPINRMDIRLPQMVRELALFGEQAWPAFTNEHDGLVRLASIDPGAIATVVTDPGNNSLPIGLVLKSNRQGRQPKWKIIINGPESVLSLQAQKVRETFTDGECFYFAINSISGGARGRSDLLAPADWLDGYDQWLFGELERSALLKSFIWDVTLKGADEATVKKRARDIGTPKPNSVRVHNDSEVWDTQAPTLQAADSSEFARMLRNHILGGQTMPEHWYGGGGDVNRSTAGEMGEPTFKIYSMRQRYVGYCLVEVATFQIRQRLLKHYGAEPSDAEWEDYLPQPAWPEMTARDTSSYAAALVQVVVGAGQAVDRGMLTEEKALELIGAVSGRLGVAIDPVAELENAREALKERKRQQQEDDAFTPPVDEEAEPQHEEEED